MSVGIFLVTMASFLGQATEASGVDGLKIPFGCPLSLLPTLLDTASKNAAW